MSSKAMTGTREWAEVNKNIQLGCENDCLYCYAKASAVRFKRCAASTWRAPQLRPYAFLALFKGRVMFPSAHDITPMNLHRCEEFLRQLLEAGSQVLIVTKPRLTCVTRLLKTLRPWRGQVLWRMTIGSFYQDHLSWWEPGAPGFQERLACLQLAHKCGWQTSVSMEPILDDSPGKVISRVRPFVTESIWLGLMKHSRQRLALNMPGDALAVNVADRLAEFWNKDHVRMLYDANKNEPLIRWKDSIRTFLGIR